jgi:hypothetical protein
MGQNGPGTPQYQHWRCCSFHAQAEPQLSRKQKSAAARGCTTGCHTLGAHTVGRQEEGDEEAEEKDAERERREGDTLKPTGASHPTSTAAATIPSTRAPTRRAYVRAVSVENARGRKN